MNKRVVTERDFRMPEFRDENPEDYEFRADGKPVRKDRWERGFRNIVTVVAGAGSDFEISDIVDAVRRLVAASEEWEGVLADEAPRDNSPIDVRLADGSVLRNARYIPHSDEWLWLDATIPLKVTGWRPAVGFEVEDC